MGKHSAKEPDVVGLLFKDDGRRSPFPYCVGIEDGMDGFAVHHPDCRFVGKGYTGPNSDCVGGSGHRYRGPVQEWEKRGYYKN